MTTASLQNSEVLPGYITTERIGAGGYGEVWRAEAPGGFEKAIKIVYGFHDDERATRELKALERIKRVRHPFVLSVERAEVVDGRLAILTELAEMSLDQRFEQYRSQDLPGIPRGEVLGYMRDAADALDYLLREHVLQHLDIKPENLLLIGGHVKVADFGLIKRVSERTEHSMVGGMTPTYAAPEIFDGRPSPYSDQYSLAIVYQEMLTGTLPFPGRTSAQLALQHTQGRPILTALSAKDREVVAKALAKRPADRFASCLQFVEALSGSRRTQVTSRPSESAAAGEESPFDTQTIASAATERVAPAGGSRPRPPSHEVVPTESIGAAAVSSDSSPAPVVAARAVPAEAAIRVSTAIVDAAVPPVDATCRGIRPTLYVGIGGVGARVLTRLRERLAADERADWSAVFPMLLCDTDRATIQSASSGVLGGSLRSGELCHLPLRKSQQYRSESPKLLNWLSRRWLYNIPRSLQTRGFRPLGRLAMIDHAQRLQVALQDSLTLLAGALPAEVDERPIRADEPRVVLVASSDGGTGAGIVVDVAFAVRSLAGELGVACPEVCGLLAHATGRQQEQTELALANTYALLSELATIQRTGYRGGHSPDARTACFEGDALPFDHLYFLHLGDELAEPQFADSVQRVAEYLYYEATTPLGEALAQCRKTANPTGVGTGHDVRLRSFSLVAVCPEEPADAAETTCDADCSTAPALEVAEVLPAAETPEDEPSVLRPDETPEKTVCLASLVLDAQDPTANPDAEPSHSGVDHATDTAIESALTSAAIELSECGYVRRRILLAPRDQSNQKLSATAVRVAPGSTVIAANADAPTVLCEVENLSLAQVAARLIECRPDVAEAAHRLHTRSDIEWQPLPQVVEEA